MKRKIAIIGAGISGLSIARMLSDLSYEVTVLEKENQIGGLIKCSVEDGVLYHRVGGHVFNTKNPRIADWFWRIFEESEFIKAQRNAKIWMFDQYIGYPIENHLYQLDKDLTRKIITELIFPTKKATKIDNFDDFLFDKFGETLCNLYFKPYNQKIWGADLSEIALPWLEGKLPMPDIQNIIIDNIYKGQEMQMVHSSFFYPKKGGSSFIAERISSGLDIQCNANIFEITKSSTGWLINGHTYDQVVYTGDVRLLNKIINTEDTNLKQCLDEVVDLKSHGTSNALCYVDESDLSWLYLPNKEIQSHRIIYTGNFSPENNKKNTSLTCTVEFSGILSEEEMKLELGKLPFKLQPIAFNQEPNSYVIQDINTKGKIDELKKVFSPHDFFLLGRFAEWEYYNMDKAIEASMSLIEDKFSH